MDLIKVANILAEKIKREYKDDIAVMCLYGSYIYGDIQEDSDIDFYFVPKTPRGFQMMKAFIIGDTGFDLWPLHWERVEKIARYGERTVPIVADARVFYYATEEDLERFNKLQEIARNPKGVVDFNARLKTLFNEICAEYFSILENRDDFTQSKLYAMRLLDIIVELVAVGNHTYIKRGWGKAMSEILAMKNVPEKFEELFRGIAFAENYQTLTASVFELMQSVKKDFLAPDKTPLDIKKTFFQLFEEEKSVYNKAYRGCNNNDSLLAVMAGASLQDEIVRCIGIESYRKEGFPDLISSFTKDDLPGYKKAVQQHEKQFEEYLKKNGIAIVRYGSIDEFERDMQKPG